jgi:Cu(I)/Ag(I) efflux system membrane fusion protein
MQIRKILITLVLVAIGTVIGIGAERFLLADRGPANTLPADEAALEHARKHLAPDYVCPMHPDVVSPQPGTCPVCGMDLVEKKTSPAMDGMKAGLPGVAVTPAFIHNFGVRTAVVTRGPVARRIEAIGRVSRMPQPRVTEVTPGLAGRLAALTEKEVGTEVNKGEQLFTVDAPEWRRLQQFFLEAIEDGDEPRTEQLKQRLQGLGMTAARLEHLQHDGQVEQTLGVYAPVSGTIVDRSLSPDEAVEAQSKVVTLGGMNRVPVIVSAFEGQGAWIDRGQRITVRVPTLPGTEFVGKVDRTDREINFSTRTLPVYVGFNTADPRIRYGMLVDVTIEAAARQDVLRIPREALIRTGSGDRVIVARGEGRFQPVEVVPGLESGEFVEILSGVEEGQVVVVSGQFLFDSESSLKTSLERMGGGDDAP